ncbi:MAG: helix-turn-helix domain-containing protein [Rhizobiales bacterium]|nr:helix-turn-helix domain-containing protein [Hyphomicrobiales bacterium]
MSNQKPLEDKNYFVKSFAKGLAIFECFDKKDDKMSLTEVAKKVGITRAAARRFLLTLEDLGYAEQQDKKFSLTAKVLNISKGVRVKVDVWAIAKKHMQTLVLKVDEAASAAILDGYEIEYVARIGTPHRIMSVTPGVGSRYPAHITSTGRAILAFSGEAIIEDYLKNASFKKYTEFSINDCKKLKSTLTESRHNSYVVLNQELEIGLRSIAVPLFDNQNRVIGALTIGTHISRVSEHKLISVILPALRACVSSINYDLENLNECE